MKAALTILLTPLTCANMHIQIELFILDALNFESNFERQCMQVFVICQD